MGNPSSFSLKFALIVSFSLAASSYTTSSSFFFKPHNPPSNRKFTSAKPSTAAASAKASAADLLSLLGTTQQASSINHEVAAELQSCFKFLVPFSPAGKPCSKLNWLSQSVAELWNRRMLNWERRGDCQRGENELVWWPPAPVLELARLAVDSGGDPGSIHRVLDPTMIPVPDVEGSKNDRCELTRTPYGRRFINEELNSYMEFLFKLIADRGPKVGLDVSLSRYDLFHGHVFISADGRLGILFHAKEYPAFDREVFPYNTGYCQRGSNVTYDDSMNLRNILWLAPLPSSSTSAWSAPGMLVVLDARPGGIIYRDLIPEYVKYARTIYEEDFGDVVVDVNYLNVGSAVADYQIFIC